MNNTKRDEPPTLGAALGMLASKECRCLKLALAMRKERQKGIHEARKSCRRLRSLLSFLRSSSQQTDALDKTLKQLAHSLAPLRDAHVAVRTARLLTTTHQTKLTHGLVDVLEGRSTAMLGEALQDDPDWRGHRIETNRITAALMALRWDELTPSVAKHALRRSSQRMKRAKKEALEQRTAVAYHHWRRRARKLRYQLELLRKARRMADMKKKRSKQYQVRAKKLTLMTEQLGWRQDFQMFIKAIDALPDSAEVIALRRTLKLKSDALSKLSPKPDATTLA